MSMRAPSFALSACVVACGLVAAACPPTAVNPSGCKTGEERNDAGACVKVEVDNSPPRLFADPPFGLGYDCVNIGCDTERRMVIENRGGGTVRIALIRLSVASSTDFTVRRGDGAPLPFNEDTTVDVTADTPLELFVRYAPSDGVDDEGVVEIDWYDGKERFADAVLTTAELPLSTRTLGAAAAQLASTRLNFGFVPVGAYATRDIVVENVGQGAVLAAGPVTLAEGTLPVFSEASEGAWAEQFVNPGESARIPVMFRPNGPGVFTGSVFVVTNDGAAPAVEVIVEGTAVEEARAAVVGVANPVDVGELRIGLTRNIDFRVQNQGGTPLVVNVGATGAGLAVFPQETITIGALETAAFTAVWTPASGGAFAGSIMVNSNDAASPLVVAVNGFGTAPSLAAAPAAVDFGPVVQTWTTGAQNFALTNAGFGDLIIESIAFEVGSSSQIRFADVPSLPRAIKPGDPPVNVGVFLEANTLGTTNAVVLVGTNSVDNGLGAGGIARLNITGRVITCEEGCPVANGTPQCGSGACEVGGCNARFYDANEAFFDGCECGEDLIPGGGGGRRDIDGQCPSANIGPLGDDCADVRLVRRAGTLHADNDVDLYFFRATDDSEFFGCDFGGDSFDVRIRLEGAPGGMQVCARRADDGVGCGGENQRTCVPAGSEIRFDGNSQLFGDDDTSDITVWVEWRPDAAPQCGTYTLAVKGDGGF